MYLYISTKYYGQTKINEKKLNKLNFFKPKNFLTKNS